MVPVMPAPDAGAALTSRCDITKTKINVSAAENIASPRYQACFFIKLFLLVQLRFLLSAPVHCGLFSLLCGWVVGAAAAGAAAAFGLIGFRPSCFAISFSCVCIGCSVRK